MKPSTGRASGLIIAFLFFSYYIMAQRPQLYAYQDLSKFSFAKQDDSLKKNWVCPELYKEKATQKKYKEIWDGRTDFITSAIEANNYINDGEIYNYINQIIIDLTKGNPSLIKQKQLLLIDRSASVNAYAVGGNVIAVNLGLITFSQSREEVALVVAHELSHNILNHPENSMKEMAVWLTSEEYKNSLNAVLDSKYERLTKLKKVVEGYTFSRNKHHRYHESEADSLAIVLLRNSNISFDPKAFLRLDSTDNEYKEPLKNETKTYFASYNTTIEDWWFSKRTKGLSSKNYNFKDTTKLNDSLKTHPDCIERYNKTKNLVNIKGAFTPVTASIKEKANKMLLWNMYDNMDLTACLYRIFLEKDKGNADTWYDFMAHNVLAGLNYSNKQLNRFNAIGIRPKEYISKNYYELQTMLEQIPADNLEQLYKSSANQSFWGSMSAESKGLKALMSTLNFDTDDNDKKKASAAKEFISSNPTSMYCEFADHFKK
ncbi:M48 family metalloprotease [Ferruginibacter sp. SUN106]|uniref:M48 family metalloprotease n=1 Tax=Ferruginibacter sp. SUN106 TaxID=2978348 RepID=UPI003D360D82